MLEPNIGGYGTPKSVADTGFHEGGFHSNNARGARVRKICGHTHKVIETTPIFECFRDLPSLSIDPFLTEIVPKTC